MCSRGPYKRYRVDAEIPVPRRTEYRRRQQHCELDVLENGNIQDGGNVPDNNNMLIQGEYFEMFPLPQVQDANVVENLEDFHDEQESGSDTDDLDDPLDDMNEDVHEGEGFQVFNIENGNVPLHPGTDITQSQIMLLIVSLTHRHKLTDEALKDLLSILNLLHPNMFPSSKYKFYKAFNVEESEVHFYCSVCTFYLEKDRTRRDCQNCSEPFVGENSMKNGTFFLYVPLQRQLKNLLMNTEIHAKLTNRNLETITQSNVISDVTSSMLYRQPIQHHHLSCNDISITWNADGVPIFKSSKYAIWPIQCMVNELPPHLRPKNVLLTGLWFGHSKPEMNTFLKPFVNECHRPYAVARYRSLSLSMS